MASYTKMTEKLILEATNLAKMKKTKLTPEILLEASENLRKSREPAPDPPECGISLSEAERRYGIQSQTISRWIQKNYLEVLLKTKREVFVDQIQLENLIGYYKQDPGQGKFTLRYLFGKGHPRNPFFKNTNDN